MADNSLSSCLQEIKGNRAAFYVYLLLRRDGTPFYVGCGRGRRIANHEADAATPKRSLKLNTIRKIKRAGQEVGYKIESWHETWDAAAAREIELISTIGRRDLGLGPLTNATAGGEGSTALSPQGRKRKSEAAKKMWQDPATRARLKSAFLIAQNNPKSLARKSADGKRNWANPYYRSKVMESRRVGGNLVTEVGLEAARKWHALNPRLSKEFNERAVKASRKWALENPARHREIARVGGAASSKWCSQNPIRAIELRMKAGKAAGQSHRLKAEIRERCIVMVKTSATDRVLPSGYAGWRIWQKFEIELLAGIDVAVR